MLGFIRPEYDYKSLEALVEDIKIDCEVAGRSLGRAKYQDFRGGEWGGWLRGFEWVERMGAGEVERVERREMGEGEGGSKGEEEGESKEEGGKEGEGKL